MKRILNRKPMLHDPRDYRLGDFITPKMRSLATTITKKEWNVGKILDQEDSPHCVGFAWAGFGIASPVEDDWDNEMGHAIYYDAKIIDGQPNEENGSDTRSGVKAFTKHGELSSYAFASSVQDIIDWVLTKGTVVTGTYWHYNMMFPDFEGLVHLGGGIAGGHEWEICGADTEKKLFKCVNSWGTEWGLDGYFYISFDDYEKLLYNWGDACTAVELDPNAEPPVPAPDSKGCLSVFYNFFGV